MKQVLIFAIVLLAALSMVNAAPLQKRETAFGQCPPIANITKQPDLIKSVKLSPDPVVPNQNETFTISTTLSSDITTDYKLVIAFADAKGNLLQQPSVFDITKDIPAGQEYDATVVVPGPAGATAPPGYLIAVGISTIVDPPSIIGCALALVGLSSGPTSYPIASYPIASYPIAERSYPIAEEEPDSYPIA